VTREPIGYPEALDLTLGSLSSLDDELVALAECHDRIAARDLRALVDSPSVNASLKDGFAVCSRDVEGASSGSPVALRLLGTAAAGRPFAGSTGSGRAVRILSGGRIPDGSDAVVAGEFATVDGDAVIVTKHAEPGRNVFRRGGDVTVGERLVQSGTRLSPGRIGLLAAAGYGAVPVFRRPNVALIATGDEVVMPGRPLPEGKVHASNLATLNAWCRRFGMAVTMEQVPDDPERIRGGIVRALEGADALVTSGGAWTGDRDLVATVLERLGWTRSFHRIRIGPGKAVGFGLLNGKPVFVLPGGPPSNLMAFLAIALPGLLKLEGRTGPPLPLVPVKIGRDVVVRDRDWTQFLVGTLEAGADLPLWWPLGMDSRLRSLALAEAVVAVPEGIDRLEAGVVATAWDLS
jgi:molybdopterin molybdotransferase